MVFFYFQESNFKLTQGIEEAIGKIQAKNSQLEELQLKIDADSRLMSEQAGHFCLFKSHHSSSKMYKASLVLVVLICVYHKNID